MATVATSYDTAMALGTLAGDQSARLAGRQRWAEEDYQLAMQVVCRLLEGDELEESEPTEPYEDLADWEGTYDRPEVEQ